MTYNYRMHCGEVWGGIEDADQDLVTAALDASLFSRSTEGGKGGDMYYLSVCGADMLTGGSGNDIFTAMLFQLPDCH